TVDQVGTSFERSRAAAVSMIPTTTSAANLVTAVLPNLEGRISVAAVRVPSISVSAIDAVVQITEWPDEPIEEFLQHAFETSDTVGITHDACVSSDLRGRPESLIIALPEVQTVAEKQIRILGWYDNEWGFSARMLDMAERMASRNKE
ncbi:MAG: aldehyde dehydrogenase, partial [Planktomarina sp.]